MMAVTSVMRVQQIWLARLNDTLAPFELTFARYEALMLAYCVVAAEHQGVPPERLSGMIQADILKEYIAQKEWCFPVDPAMHLMVDMIEWCSQHTPRWHPVSISGYHIREAGSTEAQEQSWPSP
jgi:methylmalonyl-CoA mutase N-terminal domain/subunit